MAEYTLYGFAQSGNSYRAALMLNLVGADWEPRFVDFFGGETRSAEYRENVNEMGEAPVLAFGDTKISQSGVILDYLAEKFGKFRWESEDERREVLRWLLFDNQKCAGYMGPLRFLRTIMKAGETDVVQFLHGRMTQSQEVLDKHLTGRDWIVGDRPTIADVSMTGYFYWPEEVGYDLGAYPGIGAWLDRVKALPGWEHPYEILPGHPLPEKD
jgi:glutathione S-transferase